MTSQPYGSQLLPMSQPVNLGPYQQSSSMPGFSGPLQPNMQISSDPMQNSFANDIWPDLDISNGDFANNYGNLEYTVLGHMSSGMVDTPPNESAGGFESADGSNYGPGVMSTSYGSSPTTSQQYQYPQPDARQEAIAYNLGGQSQEPFVKQEDPGMPLSGSSIYPSPVSGQSPQGMRAGFEGNPPTRDIHTNINQSRQAQGLRERPQSHPQSATSEISTSAAAAAAAIPTKTSLKPQISFSRRSRNPSTIYNMVTEPYSYTKAFHDLMALIRKRFSQKRTAHIAKALASIRPSFISSLTKLDDDDRVFMEKCLQRTLLEYEDNLNLTGTPTVLCRRTGEVVAVGEGFSILTGWKKSVLLGKEPNLNVNKGGEASGPPGTGASTSRGTNTPGIPDTSIDDPQPKPVSIVDLLDDESACDFFDDYAHLAFGDSRGSVTTPCKLLKYRTAKDFNKSLDSEVGSRLKQQQTSSASNRSLTGTGKGGGVGGGEDDKVECMLCWSVKRDVFDIPMLFVMNVLPCI